MSVLIVSVVFWFMGFQYETDKKYVQRRVDLLEAEGIEFVVSTEIGKDIPPKNL